MIQIAGLIKLVDSCADIVAAIISKIPKSNKEAVVSEVVIEEGCVYTFDRFNIGSIGIAVRLDCVLISQINVNDNCNNNTHAFVDINNGKTYPAAICRNIKKLTK